MSDITVYKPKSIIGRVVDAVRRALRLSDPDNYTAGAAYSEHSPGHHDYSPINALSSIVAFPYIRACIDAITEDICSLAWDIYRGEEKIEDHPAVRLYSAPHVKTTWRDLLSQLIADYELSGDCFAIITDKDSQYPSMVRIHPEDMRPLCDRLGSIIAYEHTPTGDRYDIQDIFHVKAYNWQNDPRSLTGASKIQALERDLNAEMRAKQMAAYQAQKGRFDFVISPKTEGVIWTEAARKNIADQYERAAQSGKGALVVGSEAMLTPVSLSPRDLEYIQMSDRTRSSILAIFSVPPARVGLETANYATAEMQKITYWNTLKAKASAFAEEFSRLSRVLSRDSRDVFRFDYSDIPELQASRTAQLQRVQMWTSMGFDAEEAALKEGFPSPPKYSGFGFSIEPSTQAEEENSKGYNQNAGSPSFFDLNTEGGRLAKWKSYLSRLQGPSERAIQEQLAQYWSRQLSKINEILENGVAKSYTKKGLNDELLAFFSGEMQEAKSQFRPIFSAVTRLSYEESMSEIAPIAYTENEIQIAKSVTNFSSQINTTSREVVISIVNEGLDQGASIADIQRAIQQSRGYSPARALRIARTESTKIVNEGTVQSYREAQRVGIVVKKQWLSARDGSVRQSHRNLDGQTVGPNAVFKTIGGQEAQSPGSFPTVAENVNCRCTVVPVVE